MSAPRLVLASSSPRRQELLLALGIEFEVRPVDLDESPRPDERAEDLVLRLAREKAQAHADSGEIVLAADTVVVLQGEILGKPTDPADARSMLERLQRAEHEVFTGVAVIDGATGVSAVALERTRVLMSHIGRQRIAWYVATEEPLDKAGAYAIQGLGAIFVESIDGNYTNVVGLPLPTARALVAELGHDLLDFRAAGARGGA